MKQNIIKPGGLHTDNSPVDQPKDSTRFVLNGVDETDDGHTKSNEESNEQCYQLTPGYVPLGDVFIDNGNRVVFSVAADESSSEIGTIDIECNYTPLINANLGFRLNQPIDATYRLRRGCERTIYWVDPRPRALNIDGLDDYKDELGNWFIPAFNLFRDYDSIPVFSDFEIGEEGNIEPSSINFAVQYLDGDFNPTEWIATSEVINIYNDSVSKNYLEIRGSSNRKSDLQNFGKTNKSVKVTMSNLDTNFPFYRIAIIKADNGSGQITAVEYSPEIPIQIPTYTYTGQGTTNGSLEEVQSFRDVIEQAQHIAQLENKLLLSNVKGKQIDFCKLQKYASRVKTDVVFKEVILNQISESNPKSPMARIDGVGYMPGEIESFGLVYVFDDGSTSPAYHIPGRNPNYPSKMSTDNVLADTYYTDNASCDDYWGVDSEGQSLKGKKVRHHRFPLRSEVNKLLYTRDGSSQELILKELVLKVTGEISSELESIPFVINYSSAGVSETFQSNINVATYDPAVGKEFRIATSTKDITVDKVYENGVLVSGTSPSGLTYTGSNVRSRRKIEDHIYKSKMFGIKFSGIERPKEADTNGNKVVGYYIVKNERTDDQKTILDSGVLMPMVDEEYFVGHGHIIPNIDDQSTIKKDAFALIHPEHKFLNHEHKNTSTLLQEGEFTRVGQPVYSKVLIQDVLSGSSYDPEVHRRKEADNDGFDLHLLTREHQMSFQGKRGAFLTDLELDEIFYLDSLNSKTFTDTDGERKELFNVSGDNKIAVVTSTQKKTLEKGKLPYVVMKRNLANPYGNFRYLPYYQQSKNVNFFFDANQSEETTIFAGDAYVTPVRYANSLFYNAKPAPREQKKSFWDYALGGLAIAAGAAITIFSAGLAAPLGVAVTAAGIAGVAALGVSVAALGVSMIGSGISKDKILRVYNDLYDAGLRNCVKDKDMQTAFDYTNRDDEVQWMGEMLTNLWFESSVNMSLRQGLTMSIPDFLNAPAVQSEDVGITTSTPAKSETQTEVDAYFVEKLTQLDPDNGSGRLYRGYAVAEFYDLNLDYLRKNNVKIYNHLGIEYDCCSDCNEEFTHRTHWSETSFQEELSDNYRVFLPNNYRDIEGETGGITALHRIQNNLYIHTTGSLWHLPQNLQERVTGDIISFIGTGEFFNVPPRKIVDDEMPSAGTRHKSGIIKTKYGIVFPCIDDRKLYLFNGNQLEPISDFGNSFWFKRSMPFLLEEQYYASNRRPYPYSDNPSSQFGIGYLTAYDANKERILLTKKDYSLTPQMIAKKDYEVSHHKGGLVLFENYDATIQGYRQQGYKYEGINQGRMNFSKEYYKRTMEERIVSDAISIYTDVHIFYGNTDRDTQLKNEITGAVNEWINTYRVNNPDWQGTFTEHVTTSERYLDHLAEVTETSYAGQNLNDKSVLIVSFVTGSQHYGSNSGVTSAIAAPNAMYTDDFENFKTVRAQYADFTAVLYPIVTNDTFLGNTIKASFQRMLAAMKGRSYTTTEADAIPYNDMFTLDEWSTLKASLKGVNPYPDDGLEQYGYVGKWYLQDQAEGLETHTEVDEEGNLVFLEYNVERQPTINSVMLGHDLNRLIEVSQTKMQTKMVEVLVPQTVYDYVNGVPLAYSDFIAADNSWTMSFSLKKKQWVSWHSYCPNYYFSSPANFYSWIYGNDYCWRHNRRGHFQTFYGTYYPHIVEYISVSSPIQNRIWDSLVFQTQAHRYLQNVNSFVDDRFITFNKMLVYNSRQISGELNMRVQDATNGDDYLNQQISNRVDEVLIDNNEGDWYVNGFRDMRNNYSIPMFNSELASLQARYFTDKVVNDGVIDFEKDWSEMESFRDKYLSIRLIFDTFDNVKLITNYSVELEDNSLR